VRGHTIKSNKFGFTSSHVLLGKLRPYLNKVVVPTGSGICSTDILPLRPDQSVITREFLALALRSPDFIEFSRAKMEGTKMPRLRTPDLEGYQIPVPSPAEQRRIVGRIEALARRLEEARHSRQSAFAEAKQAYAAALASAFADLDRAPTRPLGEIAGIIGGNSIPENAPAPVSSTDRVGLMKVSDMNAEGNESVVARCRLETSAAETKRRKLRVLPPGAVVFPKRGGAIATNKKRTLAIPAALDPNMMGVFPLPGSGLESTFLRWWFESIDLASLQEDGGIPQVNKKHLDPLDVPLPDPIEQCRIVARLDALRAKADELQRLQREVEAELDAFTPALLAKAFRGEL
jgi:type I restriction enzyme S subunit